VEVAGLDVLEEFVAGVAGEAVVVLVLNVDNELEVAGLGRLSEGLDLLDSDGTLELLVLDVVELLGG
jgi:hypothetical protein